MDTRTFIENGKKKSAKELMEEIGTDRTPTVVQIIEYFENKAIINPVGKMSTKCYVNKEALRLAAVYLKDVYLN